MTATVLLHVDNNMADTGMINWWPEYTHTDGSILVSGAETLEELKHLVAEVFDSEEWGDYGYSFCGCAIGRTRECPFNA